ncbi:MULTISPECIES: hypothetical protein [unclassified Flavobacterium]|uniref:hypothetical protein n=1 Tax=unclassified Flavobacterium TaxID=196869 RepID=UPI001F148AE8|nr:MULTISPECIES: hypothetical protein [unclassified Flavobacterium]UMY64820.1 hypothetical protein MKO97_09875 [Flavobacterium sp. HJ-32-4]
MTTPDRIATRPAAERARLFVRLTCLAALAFKFVSWPLWTGGSRLPIVPALPVLEGTPLAVHVTLTIWSVLFLIILFFRPGSAGVARVLLVLELALCLLDQARWQPWEYQLVLTFTFLSLGDTKRFLQLTALLVGAIYVFAGIHKIHPAFLHLVWDAMILKPFFGVTSASSAYPWLHRAGLLLPLAEVAVGVALLFVRHKRVAVMGALLLQTSILLLVGPWATGKNDILVAWNLWMAASVLLLFPTGERMTLQWKRFPEMIALVLVVVMPIVGFFGFWPHYLSFDLYTGKAPYLLVEAERLPPQLRPYRSAAFSREGVTEAVWWHDVTSAKAGAMPYPETGYYQKLAREWKRLHPHDGLVFKEARYPFGPSDFKEVK